MDTIFKTEIEEKLIGFCDGVLTPLGYRVVDVDCRLGGRSLVRVYAEKVSDGSMGLEDCAEVSRALENSLESAVEFPGPYDLEVSSPGLDRRLRLSTDFEKVKGREVKLGLLESLQGVGANVRGRVERVEPGQLWLDFQGRPLAVDFLKIKKAQCIWEFGTSGGK